MESSEPSEEVDAFTREYTKILRQLPSMLEEPMPKHLENYIKSTKKDRPEQQQKLAICYTEDGASDATHDEYPPLMTDSYFNLSSISCHDKNSRKRRNKQRSSSSSSGRSSRAHKKRAILDTHYIYDDHSCRTHTADDDALTIQKLQRINELLTTRDTPPAAVATVAAQPAPITHTNACVQTDSVAVAAVVDTLHRHTQTYIASQHKTVQTDAVEMAMMNMHTDSKIAQMISKLSDELADKSEKYTQLQHDHSALEGELKSKHTQIQQLTANVNAHKQQIEDHSIYCHNLLKHLDEKSRNEALLRREIHEHQKQLETAHVKLQHHPQQQQSSSNANAAEMKELREHLMVAEQKCLDWKKKWKQQCYRLEQYESEKVMTQHRIDQQLIEYQRIIQDFRDMMKNNLESVNENFQRLQVENTGLKQENEKLLAEMGKIQETAFGGSGSGDGDTVELKQNLSDKNSQIQALTQQLTQFQSNLELTHLNGTNDKAVQCIMFAADDDVNRDQGHARVPDQELQKHNVLINKEFNELSIEIFKLSINLQSKSSDVMNEYGFCSVNNSPLKKGKTVALLSISPNASLFDVGRMDDTDDIDKTSIVVNCKKRFYETKQILKQLLKCFDDVMYEQATKQADHCITQ